MTISNVQRAHVEPLPYDALTGHMRLLNGYLNYDAVQKAHALVAKTWLLYSDHYCERVARAKKKALSASISAAGETIAHCLNHIYELISGFDPAVASILIECGDTCFSKVVFLQNEAMKSLYNTEYDPNTDSLDDAAKRTMNLCSDVFEKFSSKLQAIAYSDVFEKFSSKLQAIAYAETTENVSNLDHQIRENMDELYKTISDEAKISYNTEMSLKVEFSDTNKILQEITDAQSSWTNMTRLCESDYNNIVSSCTQQALATILESISSINGDLPIYASNISEKCMIKNSEILLIKKDGVSSDYIACIIEECCQFVTDTRRVHAYKDLTKLENIANFMRRVGRGKSSLEDAKETVKYLSDIRCGDVIPRSLNWYNWSFPEDVVRDGGNASGSSDGGVLEKI